VSLIVCVTELDRKSLRLCDTASNCHLDVCCQRYDSAVALAIDIGLLVHLANRKRVAIAVVIPECEPFIARKDCNVLRFAQRFSDGDRQCIF
jgi:hypothetical protein